MSMVGDERCRKKAVRSVQKNCHFEACQQRVDIPAGATTSLPIASVVSSLNLPISSIPARQPAPIVLLSPDDPAKSLLPSQPFKPVIRFGEFQQNLQGYFQELQESELAFHEEVAKINATDRLIFDNAAFLECLHCHLKELKHTETNSETTLNKLFSELNLLEETVKNLEKRLEGDVNHLNCHAGKQREILYKSAVQMDADINYLVNQLSEIICLNNSRQSVSPVRNNPIEQIGSILNHNHDALVHCEKTIFESKVHIDRLLGLQKQVLNQCHH